MKLLKIKIYYLIYIGVKDNKNNIINNIESIVLKNLKDITNFKTQCLHSDFDLNNSELIEKVIIKNFKVNKWLENNNTYRIKDYLEMDRENHTKLKFLEYKVNFKTLENIYTELFSYRIKQKTEITFKQNMEGQLYKIVGERIYIPIKDYKLADYINKKIFNKLGVAPGGSMGPWTRIRANILNKKVDKVNKYIKKNGTKIRKRKR